MSALNADISKIYGFKMEQITTFLLCITQRITHMLFGRSDFCYELLYAWL